MTIIKNKKAQSGETVTWIVATLIIIIIMVIAIYGSSLLAKTKTFEKGKSELSSSKENNNLIATKCLTGYLSTNKEEAKIYSIIKEDFDSYDGNLAKQIFEPFKNDYNSVWLGIDNQNNNYFGEKPGVSINQKIDINIKLNNNKNMELVLVR